MTRDTPVLESARLRLRPSVAADVEALHPAYADSEMMRWWSHPAHSSIEQTRGDLASRGAGWRRWMITLKDDDRAIGFVVVGEKRQGNVSEIGYLLRREYWGSGIAAEAVGCVIDRVFTEGQRRVFADTDPDNAASRRLLERLGFQLEGMLRGEWETHIGVRDTALYGLLREEWHGAA